MNGEPDTLEENMRVARFAILAIASILLYFALGMLLFVPLDPGGPYWAKERIVYGLLPLLLGGIVICGVQLGSNPHTPEGQSDHSNHMEFPVWCPRNRAGVSVGGSR